MPLEAVSVPPPLPGGCCCCLECKTQQCFSFSSHLDGDGQQSGELSEEAAAPWSILTTPLSCALGFVGSGLCRTTIKVFLHQLWDHWLDAAGECVFSVHMCICRHAKYMHLGTSLQS